MVLGWWGPLGQGALARQVVGVVFEVVAAVQEAAQLLGEVVGAAVAEFLGAKRLGRPGAVGV